MSEQPALKLTLEPADDLEFFFNTCKSIFSADRDKQSPPIPEYNEVFVARVAKTADGRVAGGVVGKVVWNCFEVQQLAVNPACRVPGTKTALLKWAEEAARGEYACNQICLGAFSWQPRSFFEKLGYTLLWEHQNYPQGHSKCYFEKVWTMDTRDAPVQGYDAAATAEIRLEEWDVKEARSELHEWAEEARTAAGATELTPYTKETISMKALHEDGTLAACCRFSITWNVLHVDILCVLLGGQRRGVGTAVLRKVDELARKIKCSDVYLETMSWQARPFYEKNGYTLMATQHDLPVHYERYIMLHHVPEETASQL